MFGRPSGRRRCARPVRGLLIVNNAGPERVVTKGTHVESLVFRVEPNVGFDRADSVRERLVHGHVAPVVVVRVDLALRAVKSSETVSAKALACLPCSLRGCCARIRRACSTRVPSDRGWTACSPACVSVSAYIASSRRSDSSPARVSSRLVLLNLRLRAAMATTLPPGR